MSTYKEALKKLRQKKKTKIVRKKPTLKKSVKRVRVKKVKPVKRKLVKKRKIIKKRVVRKQKPKKIVKRKKVVKRKRVIKKRKPMRKKVVKPRVYVGKGTLDQLFESQAKVKLLRFFFRNAEEIFQLKDIFKRLRTSPALLRQEMKKLENLGLIKQKKAWLTFEKKRGGTRKEKKTVYYLNLGFDFFNELRDLILKSTIASKSDLVEKARKLGNIKLLVLAGIFTGDATAKADLLIVGDKISHKKLNNFIKDIEAEVGKQINCAVLMTKEFNYRYDMYDRFVRDLLDSNCEILIKKVELW